MWDLNPAEPFSIQMYIKGIAITIFLGVKVPYKHCDRYLLSSHLYQKRLGGIKVPHKIIV